MIKAILFDLGKVIIPFDFNRGYRAMQQICGHEPADIRARIAATDLVERFECGHVEPRAFVAQLRDVIGLDVSYDGFCEIWSSIFLPDPLIPESLLAGLKMHYPLLLVSNTNPIHFGMIRETYPLLRHFDEFILSYEVKAMKPSPEIYRAAVERAGCQPGECFFTDDIPAYVEGARRHGIDAVQFQSAEQIERELRARGIRWD